MMERICAANDCKYCDSTRSPTTENDDKRRKTCSRTVRTSADPRRARNSMRPFASSSSSGRQALWYVAHLRRHEIRDRGCFHHDMMEPHEAERRPKWLGICGKGAVACLLFFPKCGLKAPVWLRPGSAAWPQDWQSTRSSISGGATCQPSPSSFYFISTYQPCACSLRSAPRVGNRGDSLLALRNKPSLTQATHTKQPYSQ